MVKRLVSDLLIALGELMASDDCDKDIKDELESLNYLTLYRLMAGLANKLVSMGYGDNLK